MKTLAEKVYMTETETIIHDDAASPFDPEKELFIQLGEKTTICLLTLPNGYEVVGSSACVNPEDYSWELGCEYAKQDAYNKIEVLKAFSDQTTLKLQSMGLVSDDIDREMDIARYAMMGLEPIKGLVFPDSFVHVYPEECVLPKKAEIGTQEPVMFGESVPEVDCRGKGDKDQD